MVGGSGELLLPVDEVNGIVRFDVFADSAAKPATFGSTTSRHRASPYAPFCATLK
jgi:hypothetical protein